MTVHAMPGLRVRPLLHYLAGLGLARVLAEQDDPRTRVWWESGELRIETRIDDVARWLCEEYVPSPVVSPWNSGSGFGAKDKTPKQVLDKLLELDQPRVRPLQETIRTARSVVESFHGAGVSPDKAALRRRCRNRFPEAAVPWLDAAVVDTLDGLAFPLLLGTGGNDGRLDFSTNYHQHLLNLLDTRPKRRTAAQEQARACLEGHSGAGLATAAVGQYDPAAAGGANSAWDGAALSLVNPWTYVLAVEGSMLFASTVTRRYGVHAHNPRRGMAASPFMVHADPVGAASLSSGEDARGEVWAPWWELPWTLDEVTQLFSEGRNQWNQRSARSAVEMYKATATKGAALGVGGFARYVVLKRNGLAFIAVPADEINVGFRPLTELLGRTDRWVDRLRGRPFGVSIQRGLRNYDAASVELARRGESADALRALANYTKLVQAVSRSARARGDVTPPALIPAHVLGDVGAELFSDPAVRIGFALASLRGHVPVNGVWGLHELLLAVSRGDDHRPQWRTRSEIPGFGARPVSTVLADAGAWWARNGPTATGLAATGPRSALPAWRGDRRVSPDDVCAWLDGDIPDERVENAVWAALAFDRARVSLPGATEREKPIPAYAALAPFAHGMTGVGDQVLGARPWWASHLRADRCEPVLTDALRRVRQAGHRPVARAPFLTIGIDGSRLAAGLLVPIRAQSLPVLLSQVASPPLVTIG